MNGLALLAAWMDGRKEGKTDGWKDGWMSNDIVKEIIATLPRRCMCGMYSFVSFLQCFCLIPVPRNNWHQTKEVDSI